MKTIPATMLRKNISRVLDAVVHRNQIVAIGRHNRAEAIILKWPARHNDTVNDITNFNANSSSFDFLADEPDMYSIDDLSEKYV